jgi:carbon monoxide dehydrogenase subunit G
VIIENEFSVGADIDAVWRQLLDMEGVASCLPGATIASTDRENVYDGSMRLKIGPMRVEYCGTATLSEVDEQNHTAVISLSAREAKGQGSAMATIRNRLEPADSGTRVTAQTELQITGPQAQFGQGVIEDVGRRVLGEFARRLEQRIAAPASEALAATAAPGVTDAATQAGETTRAGSANETGAAGAGASPRTTLAEGPAPNELDLGRLLSRTPALRLAAAGIALLVLAAFVLRRRR